MYLTALTISNLKCHILPFIFRVGFITTNENQWREYFKILPTQSYYDTLLTF
jgi:hypothetical protein